MCVVATALFALLTLDLVLPTQAAGPSLFFFIVVLYVQSRGVVLLAVSVHACLPTSIRRTVVTEYSTVIV